MNHHHQHHHHIYELCKKHIHSYVLVETVDGVKVDGVVTGLDDQFVYLAVPNTDISNQQRVSPGYGYPPYGYGYPGGRFRRLVLPLAALVALSALPWY